ncbi:MAG TPA: ATP-binding cassette domain-containing protein [Vicinamibacterales bacterium]|nr:ATP-binding cassette domain-containing protein [Vicinamibacterales bacterium]
MAAAFGVQFIQSDTDLSIARTGALSGELFTGLLTLCGLATTALAVRHTWMVRSRDTQGRALRELSVKNDADAGAIEEVKGRYRLIDSKTLSLKSALGTTTILWTAFGFVVLVTSKSSLVPADVLPSPAVVFDFLQLNAARLISATGFSLLRLVTAILVGSLLAVAMGLPLGQHQALRRMLDPVVSTVSGLPPIVLGGVLVALLGPQTLARLIPPLSVAGSDPPFFIPELKNRWFFAFYFQESVQLILTTWAVFWPVFTAAVSASVHCSVSLVEAARLSRATPSQIVRRVIAPQSLPQVFASIRISLVVGFIVLMWAETRPSDAVGLGKWVYEYWDSSDVNGVFACIILALAIVVVLSNAIDGARRLLTPWSIEVLESRALYLGGASRDATSDAPVETWTPRGRPTNFTPAGVAIEVSDVEKSYGPINALNMRGQALQIASRPEGVVVSIIGESSHGKTTLARLVAGLVLPDEGPGRIALFGTVSWQRGKVNRQSCRVAYVFQDFALFPHMTVEENIRYPVLWNGGTNLTDLDRDIGKLLGNLRLNGFEQHYPSQLSGGQKQRVAIARALLQYPDLLILDEPFASLDQPLRGEIRKLIRAYARATGVVVLNISHDRHDVLEMSDAVLYMRRGRIADYGTPMEMFFGPRSTHIAKFLGHVNIFDATIHGAVATLEALSLNGRAIEAPLRIREVSGSAKVKILIPASWFNLTQAGQDVVRLQVEDYRLIGFTGELTLHNRNGFRCVAAVQDDDLRALGRPPTIGDELEFTVHGAIPIPEHDLPEVVSI